MEESMTEEHLTSTDLKKIAILVRKLARPVDFKKLERQGLLKKRGAWYIVPNIHMLPEHVTLKISEMKQSQGSVMVKIKKASSFGRLPQKLKRLGLI
jgi:hypothetical protein